MNPNPSAYRILCYGDSNTWGRSGAGLDRYSVDIRWTALLQKQLGNEYEVIEEGLRSRTTDLDDEDSQFPGRNGLTYLRPCLESHQTLDVIILWLGTNDLKVKFNRTAEDVSNSLKQHIEMIKSISTDKNGNATKILLVSPPLIREEVLKEGSQFQGAGEKSQQLAAHLKNLAEKENTAFLDLATLVTAGEFDGVHLEPDQHPIVVENIKLLISSLFPQD
jgi:lysophospholipase L1-like esterase